MAEGWAKTLKSSTLDAFSAGTEPHGVNRLAIRAMAESGIDISHQESKHLQTLAGISFDYVVTLCDSARESCPIFPGRVTVIHRDFDDPPQLAKNATTDAEAMVHYRRVRDEIRQFIETLPEALTVPQISESN